MRRIARRAAALALAAVLAAGTAGAAGQPEGYGGLRRSWLQAEASQDPAQVLEAASRSWELLSQDGLDEADCLELEPQCALASWASEVRGDLDGARLWLDRQTACASQLDGSGEDRTLVLEALEARWAYLVMAQAPELYALSGSGQAAEAQPAASGAPASGVWYGTSAGSPQTDGTAVMVRIPFLDGRTVAQWLADYGSADARLSRAGDGDAVLLVWELSPESDAGVEKVFSAAAEDYIQEGLEAMSRLGGTVLLQVGTGPNGWSSCDPERYIQAFRQIARQARQYDNIQLVFPCSDVSRPGASLEDYYPGDSYVDWMGVSVSRESGGMAYSFGDMDWQEDARRGEGVYAANPLIKLELCAAFARERGKPVAAVFRGGALPEGEGAEEAARTAADQLARFYAYVTMRSPQVKAVFYDDSPLDSSGGAGPLSQSSLLTQAYRNAIAANGTYAGQSGAAGAWVPLDEMGESYNTLRVAACALLPGDGETRVTWYLDGKEAFTTSQIPYVYELRADDLTPGSHFLWVTVESGRFKVSGASQGIIYQVFVSDTGMLMGGGTDFQLGSASQWALSLLVNAYGRGLVTPRTSGNLQSPITRLQFAELAVNLIEQTTGEAIEPVFTGFSDTDDLAVRKAVAAGITSGRTETLFAPNDLITREEICVMLNRAIQYVDQIQGTTTLKDPDTRIDPAFVDGAEVSPWAVEAVALLTNNGVMAGKGAGRLAPRDHATVEESLVLALALRNQF